MIDNNLKGMKLVKTDDNNYHLILPEIRANDNEFGFFENYINQGTFICLLSKGEGKHFSIPPSFVPKVFATTNKNAEGRLPIFYVHESPTSSPKVEDVAKEIKTSKIVDDIFKRHRIDLNKPKFDIQIIIEMLHDTMKAYLEQLNTSWQASPKSESVDELALEAMDFYWRSLTDKLNEKELGDIERKNYKAITDQLYKRITKNR